MNSKGDLSLLTILRRGVFWDALGDFLDISQAFDKVWYAGILFKLKHIIPHNYYVILQAYLSGHHFTVKQNNKLSDIQPLHSGVPQSTVFVQYLYLIYTADIPTTSSIVTAVSPPFGH